MKKIRKHQNHTKYVLKILCIYVLQRTIDIEKNECQLEIAHNLKDTLRYKLKSRTCKLN